MNNQLDSIRGLAQEYYGDTLTEEMLWDLLSRHRCDGLLQVLPCPDAKKKNQQLKITLNTNAVLTRYRNCSTIFEALQRQSIPYVVQKGAVLSQTLHGSPFIRQSGDIDLLIRRGDADEVKSILSAHDFVQGRIREKGIVPFTRYELLYHAANTHQLAPFVKKTDNPFCPHINVDVNVDLLWGESEEMADMTFVLSHTQPTEICGVSLQKLTVEMEFVALCLHHYKDMNSLYLLYKGGMRLGHLCDIYDYLHNIALAPREVADICNCLGVSAQVKTCIILVCRIFGSDDTAESYLRELTGDDLSDRFGLKEKEYHSWDIPLSHRFFGNVREYLDQILSGEEKEKIRLNQLIM